MSDRSFSWMEILARYLASEFYEVTKLILLDGGYLDLDKILPLDTELEETKNYIESQVVSDLDVLISKEKSEAKHWSEKYGESRKSVLSLE